MFQLNASMNRHQARNVGVRWAAWCPNFRESTSEVSLGLEGGAIPNPEGILFYKMADSDQNNTAAGKLQFVFKVKVKSWFN